MPEAEVIYLATDENTVHSVLADTLNQADDFKTVMVVALGKNENIYVGHSEGSYLQKVGFLEFAKADIVEKMLNG